LKFGVHIPIHALYPYERAMQVVEEAERDGFDLFWVGDHFFLPEEVYKRLGGDPEKRDKLDAWTFLAAVAARTEKVRIGTRVSPIPFYQPSRLAKIVTTVDIISKGRVVLGVGAGWFMEEAVAYGITWDKFSVRLDKLKEGLEVIKRLWTTDHPSYSGKYYQIQKAPFYPKPIQKPHPPIWFGGSSDKILKMAAQMGQGWIPSSELTYDKLEKCLKLLHQHIKEAGRELSDVSTAAGIICPAIMSESPSKFWTSKVESLAQLGFEEAIIDFCHERVPPLHAIEYIRFFIKQIAPSYR